MDEPQILVVLIVIAFFAVALFGGGFLIFRVMNRPDSYIGSRLPGDRAEETTPHFVDDDTTDDTPDGSSQGPEEPHEDTDRGPRY